MSKAQGELRVTYADGRPARQADTAELVAERRGLTWSDKNDGAVGAIRWDDVTGWSTHELAEARRFRAARKRAQITVNAGDDLVIFLTDAEAGRDLTRVAQDVLPAGTVERV